MTPDERGSAASEESDPGAGELSDVEEVNRDHLEYDGIGPAHQPAAIQNPVITTAARTVTPFVLAYGVYLVLHGTSLPGGAFQGGIVLGVTVVLIGLAFGFAPTREWIHNGTLAAALLFGVGVFGGIALGAVAFGGDVLELFAYPLAVEWTVRIVEVAIAATIAGVITGLVVWSAAGVEIGGDAE